MPTDIIQIKQSKLDINAFDVRRWKKQGENLNFPCGR